LKRIVPFGYLTDSKGGVTIVEEKLKLIVKAKKGMQLLFNNWSIWRKKNYNRLQ